MWKLISSEVDWLWNSEWKVYFYLTIHVKDKTFLNSRLVYWWYLISVSDRRFHHLSKWSHVTRAVVGPHLLRWSSCLHPFESPCILLSLINWRCFLTSFAKWENNSTFLSKPKVDVYGTFTPSNKKEKEKIS